LPDPDVRASFAHVGIFIVINVGLTVAISLGLLRPLRDGERRRGRRMAIGCSAVAGSSTRTSTSWPNKDCVWFLEPVPRPDGAPAYAMLRRPICDLRLFARDAGTFLPAGLDDDCPGIWISYVGAAEVHADVRALTRLRNHRPVAMSDYVWEPLKMGAGPPAGPGARRMVGHSPPRHLR
jgi:hypothetical protein